MSAPQALGVTVSAQEEPAGVPIADRDAALAYVASVCFKHGPPRLTGVELEWLVHHTDDPARPLEPALLARALGAHAPPTLHPRPPADPLPDPAAPVEPAALPRGGTVTVEPGGQVEIASAPATGLRELVEGVDADAAEIRRLLGAEGLGLGSRASDAWRPPRRLLDVPRYRAMEEVFDRIGPHGRTGMSSTAAVQVCVDAGEGPAVADRWSALHELGPVLTAAFANSPTAHGRETGWKSCRMASWLRLDPERTGPPALDGTDPARAWAERALSTSVLCVRDEGGAWTVPVGVTFADWIDGRSVLPGRPTRADLDYHLTTLFPPVRPHGHVEVRYLDQQAGDDWSVPVAVVVALLADPTVLDRARAAAAPTVGRWLDAARDGLTDPELARAAAEVLGLAHAALGAVDAPPSLVERVGRFVEHRTLRGRSPADDTLDDPTTPTLSTDLPDGGDR